MNEIISEFSVRIHSKLGRKCDWYACARTRNRFSLVDAHLLAHCIPIAEFLQSFRFGRSRLINKPSENSSPISRIVLRVIGYAVEALSTNDYGIIFEAPFALAVGEHTLPNHTRGIGNTPTQMLERQSTLRNVVAGVEVQTVSDH